MDYHEMEMRAVYARTLNDLMDENPHCKNTERFNG